MPLLLLYCSHRYDLTRLKNKTEPRVMVLLSGIMYKVRIFCGPLLCDPYTTFYTFVIVLCIARLPKTHFVMWNSLIRFWRIFLGFSFLYRALLQNYFGEHKPITTHSFRSCFKEKTNHSIIRSSHILFNIWCRSSIFNINSFKSSF